jgi:DNA-binding PadR family transcriptional regulator
MTDLIMLATLLDGPKHGYQLKKQAGLIFGQSTIHNNLVYPLLRKFANQGWVTRKTTPGERGQKRQQYAITATGRKILLDRLSDFDPDAARSADGFRLRVALFGLLPEKTRAQILSARKQALQRAQERLQEIEQHVQLRAYPQEVVSFMREQMAAELLWLHHLQKLSADRERQHAP